MIEALEKSDEPCGEAAGGLRSGKLSTVAEIRAEMVNVYHAAKKKVGKDISVVAAGRLVFILSQIKGCVVDGDFEERLAALEAQKEGRQ